MKTQTKTARHIGGSILPSSSPQILQPIESRFGRLEVRADIADDTHTLNLVTAGGDYELARHGNGYSCRALGERMAFSTAKRAIEQAEYIIACGGTADVAEVTRLVAIPAATLPNPTL